ncbi:hypothetical protein K3495_g4005 [Podosphaera aphanis]|nr:hypothetical protein K3495_g4005 [Podosphaera aphanis]
MPSINLNASDPQSLQNQSQIQAPDQPRPYQRAYFVEQSQPNQYIDEGNQQVPEPCVYENQDFPRNNHYGYQTEAKAETEIQDRNQNLLGSSEPEIRDFGNQQIEHSTSYEEELSEHQNSLHTFSYQITTAIPKNILQGKPNTKTVTCYKIDPVSSRKSQQCKQCQAKIFSQNKLFKHLKNGHCTTVVSTCPAIIRSHDLSPTAGPHTPMEPQIQKSTAPLFEIGAGFGYRSHSYHHGPSGRLFNVYIH